MASREGNLDAGDDAVPPRIDAPDAGEALPEPDPLRPGGHPSEAVERKSNGRNYTRQPGVGAGERATIGGDPDGVSCGRDGEWKEGVVARAKPKGQPQLQRPNEPQASRSD
jgi:hypothetical protein